MKPKRVLFLVADAGRAAAYFGNAKAISEVASFAIENDVPPSRALGDDRPGRSGESVGPTRHAYEPTSDPHEAAEKAFARTVAEKLADAAERNEAERVVVIAAPAMLGDLRSAYPSALRALVGLEIGKDLTRLPQKDLMERLRDIYLEQL